MKEKTEQVIETVQTEAIDENVTFTEVRDPYGFIYITTNLVNGMRYLGQKKFDRKWKDYIGSGMAFKNAVKKYGKENFSRSIIKICYSADELNHVEYDLSVQLDVVVSNDWYNLVYGGGTTAGLVLSEETCARLSEMRKKNHELHPEFGEHHSKMMIEFYKENPEAKERISDRFKQLWQDPEYIEKMCQASKNYWDNNDNRIQHGVAMKATWQDPDVRAARLSGLQEWATNPEYHERRSEISKQNWDKPGFREAQIERNTGSGNPMYGVHRYGIDSPRFIPVYCIEMNRIFWGATEVENEFKIRSSDISQCCKQRPGHQSAGKHPVTNEKLHWLYAKDAIRQGYISQQDLDEYLNNLKQKGHD